MGGASTQRRDLPQALVVAMMLTTVLIVIDATNKKCGARNVTDTILWKSNDTNDVTAYEDLEMEFPMDSGMSRRILQQKKYVTRRTLDGSEDVNCGQARGENNSCVGPVSGGKPPNCRDIFDRSCKRK